jgi:hypothetical protein
VTDRGTAHEDHVLPNRHTDMFKATDQQSSTHEICDMLDLDFGASEFSSSNDISNASLTGVFIVFWLPANPLMT